MNSKQTGAVLLAVLVVLMILSFVLLSLSSVLDARLIVAQNSQTLMWDKADAYAKSQQLTYLLATQRLTVAGVSRGENKEGLQKREGLWVRSISGDEIRTDSHVYKEEEGLSYYVQNELGLIPVNSRNQFWLKRWLSSKTNSFGEINKLADTLHDYADADELQKSAGAERRQYDTLDMPTPPNFLLQTCAELKRIIPWRALLSDHPKMLSECSLERVGRLNINAIPISLWRSLWPSTASTVADMRNNNVWFTRASDIEAIEPSMIAVAEEYVSPLGGASFIVHVKKGNAHYAIEC